MYVPCLSLRTCWKDLQSLWTRTMNKSLKVTLHSLNFQSGDWWQRFGWEMFMRNVVWIRLSMTHSSESSAITEKRMLRATLTTTLEILIGNPKKFQSVSSSTSILEKSNRRALLLCAHDQKAHVFWLWFTSCSEFDWAINWIFPSFFFPNLKCWFSIIIIIPPPTQTKTLIILSKPPIEIYMNLSILFFNCHTFIRKNSMIKTSHQKTLKNIPHAIFASNLESEKKLLSR